MGTFTDDRRDCIVGSEAPPGERPMPFSMVTRTLYIAGRQVKVEGRYGVGGYVEWPQPDRLSSNTRHHPYGEERSTSSTEYKFATYQREASGLDYALNRYYSSVYGRFLSSDPYRASGGPADPGSWNRYAYVQGDPVNWVDRKGLMRRQPGQPCPAWKDSYECAEEEEEDGGGGWGAPPPPPPPEPPAPRVPRLIVKDDCFWVTGTGFIAGWTRVVTYRVVDQDGKPFFGSEVPTVRETITPTGGVEITGNGVWQRSDNSMSANGTFVDFLSSNGQGSGQADQVFRINGVPVSVDIGFGNPTTLHNTYSKTGVTINNTTSPRPCKQGDPVAR